MTERKHVTSYQDAGFVGVASCEGVALDRPFSLDAESPSEDDRCPRCGDKLRVVWRVYIEEVP